MAWEGERTVTFTMEDALISPVSFSILSGAGLIEASPNKPIIVHKTEQTAKVEKKTGYIEITLSEKPYLGRVSNLGGSLGDTINDNEDFIYVMLLDENGDVKSEPYIAIEAQAHNTESFVKTEDVEVVPGKTYYAYSGSGTGGVDTDPSHYGVWTNIIDSDLGSAYERVDYYPVGDETNGYKVRIYATETADNGSDETTSINGVNNASYTRYNDLTDFKTGSVVLVDYYVAHKTGTYQIDITPDKFGGNFYLEASTLFRAENGQDMPAEFIIPNCKIQSNFTFSMAASGDPSTFTFTMDAFPDYTRWNKEKKVFAAIQVINIGETNANLERLGTGHDYTGGTDNNPYATYKSSQKQFIEID